jgi:hypothetical protein
VAIRIQALGATANGDVDHRQTLQPDVVGSLHHQVGEQHPGEIGGQNEGPDQSAEQQGPGQRQRRRSLDAARRQGPQPLDRVQAIGLPIGQVVEDIDAAGHRGEADDRRQHGRHRRPGQHLGREEQRRCDEGVLDPLARAQQGDQRRQAHRRGTLVEAAPSKPLGCGRRGREGKTKYDTSGFSRSSPRPGTGVGARVLPSPAVK